MPETPIFRKSDRQPASPQQNATIREILEIVENDRLFDTADIVARLASLKDITFEEVDDLNTPEGVYKFLRRYFKFTLSPSQLQTIKNSPKFRETKLRRNKGWLILIGGLVMASFIVKNTKNDPVLHVLNTGLIVTSSIVISQKNNDLNDMIS